MLKPSKIIKKVNFIFFPNYKFLLVLNLRKQHPASEYEIATQALEKGWGKSTTLKPAHAQAQCWKGSSSHKTAML